MRLNTNWDDKVTSCLQSDSSRRWQLWWTQAEPQQSTHGWRFSAMEKDRTFTSRSQCNTPASHKNLVYTGQL